MYLAPSVNRCDAVPWSGPRQWQQVKRHLTLLSRNDDRVLGPLQALARSIDADLTALEPIMDSLCAATCRLCPDPCCRVATIWYDVKDLLYLHLMSVPVPEGQPMGRLSKVCSFWRPDGCRVNRRERPWICTWYLCPVQTARLRRDPKLDFLQLRDIIEAVKRKRCRLEDAFIRLVAGSGR